MKTKTLGSLAVGLLLCANVASAGTVTFSGSNVNGPLFQNLYPAYLYDFSVSTSGQYRFDTTAATFDTYIYVFPLGFDLVTPQNLLALNDDNSDYSLDCGDTGRCSTALANLVAGNDYTFVIRGYEAETGSFEAQISGPGDITAGGPAVPLPAAAWLLLSGLGGLGLLRRRIAA